MGRIKTKIEKKPKVHYIYKIYFLCGFPTGRYYLGKRTGYVDDSYGGSGNFCKAYYKKYGKIAGKTYIKEIIEINPSKGINVKREEIIIGDLWKTDPLCMNQAPGGMTNKSCGDQKVHKVRQYDMYDGHLIKEWDSISEAESELGINNISRCCTRRCNLAGQWIWRYSSDDLDYVDPKDGYCKQARAVIQCDLDGNEIRRFDRIQDAVLETGVDKKSIQECCAHRRKRGKGFIWKYVDEDYVRPCNRDLAKCGAKPVIQYDLNGNIIAEYVSLNAASKATGISNSAIRNACKDGHICFNYIWKYKI